MLVCLICVAQDRQFGAVIKNERISKGKRMYIHINTGRDLMEGYC